MSMKVLFLTRDLVFMERFWQNFRLWDDETKVSWSIFSILQRLHHIKRITFGFYIKKTNSNEILSQGAYIAIPSVESESGTTSLNEVAAAYRVLFLSRITAPIQFLTYHVVDLLHQHLVNAIVLRRFPANNWTSFIH